MAALKPHTRLGMVATVGVISTNVYCKNITNHLFANVDVVITYGRYSRAYKPQYDHKYQYRAVLFRKRVHPQTRKNFRMKVSKGLELHMRDLLAEPMRRRMSRTI